MEGRAINGLLLTNEKGGGSSDFPADKVWILYEDSIEPKYTRLNILATDPIFDNIEFALITDKTFKEYKNNTSYTLNDHDTRISNLATDQHDLWSYADGINDKVDYAGIRIDDINTKIDEIPLYKAPLSISSQLAANVIIITDTTIINNKANALVEPIKNTVDAGDFYKIEISAMCDINKTGDIEAKVNFNTWFNSSSFLNKINTYYNKNYQKITLLKLDLNQNYQFPTGDMGLLPFFQSGATINPQTHFYFYPSTTLEFNYEIYNLRNDILGASIDYLLFTRKGVIICE